MMFNRPIKRILAKWPVLLVFLMIPAMAMAQADKDQRDKDKKQPPPPPPQKAAPANPPPKQAPAPPPRQAPPQNPPPRQPAQPPQAGQPAGGQPRGGQPTGGQPTGGQPTGGQPRGGQPTGGQRTGGQPTGGQPRSSQPIGGQPTGGQQGPGHGPVPPPQQVHIHNGNATVIRSANGGNAHVTTIRTEHGVTINRTNYGRRVETVRPGGVVVVSIGNSRGFVQRPLARPGFVQRTYVVRGRPYVRVYRTSSFRGIVYQRYVPAFYFGPRFYLWAYNPWARPVYWSWGWGLAPWYYDGYFAPAPYYVSASLWLTDFIIAENLRAAYEAQQEADGNAAQYAPPPDAGNYQADPNAYNNAQISPALRQAIADEVQWQLDAERNAANSPQQGDGSVSDQAPPALAADQRVFIVSTPLQVYDGDQPCSLTAGDIISRVEDTPGNDGAVGVSVLTSKSSDCRSGAQPRILVNDLQDMQNDMRAQTDEGLKNLAQKQGTNGMPAAPDVRQTPNPNGQGTPDQDVANQLKQQQQDANQTEKEIGGPGGDGAQMQFVPTFPMMMGMRLGFLWGSPPLAWEPGGRALRFTVSRTF